MEKNALLISGRTASLFFVDLVAGQKKREPKSHIPCSCFPISKLSLWLLVGNGFRRVITNKYTYAQSKRGKCKRHNVLFDRVNDPGQLTSSFWDEKFHLIIRELWHKTHKWIEGIGDEFYLNARRDSLVRITYSVDLQNKRPIGLFY